jgi:PAS domain S-box-containing protein
MRIFPIKRFSFPVQLVITQIGLVILTAIAIGIPAIWYMRHQLEQQAQEMLDQGGRTVQALLDKSGSDLENLALLTAQRPTLQRLVAEGNQIALSDYLARLNESLNLGLVVVCGPADTILAGVGETSNPAVCKESEDRFQFFPGENGTIEGWLIAQELVPDQPGNVKVAVGKRLDAVYAKVIRDGAGLDIAIFRDEQLLSTSLSNQDGQVNFVISNPELFVADNPPGELKSSPTSRLGDQVFFVDRLRMEDGLSFLLFSSAEEILGAQQELTKLAGAAILFVIIIASVIGILLAWQVSSSLERLRDAAEGLRQGDLVTPVSINTHVREVAQVAQALEAARRSLQHSLEQLRQEKAWIEHLLEAVVEGIITIDRRGNITFFSHGAERITGWGANQVLGRSLDDVFRIFDDQSLFSQFVPAPGGMQKMVVKLEGERQATLAVSRASLAPPEAGKASAVLVLRDVSDEETIRRLLGEFLSNITHEFRTPLSALAASIELLMDQLPDLTSEDLFELLNSVHLGVLSLQTLIDNLLEGASIEAGRFRVNPRAVQLEEIIERVNQTMEPLARKYNQSISLQLPADLPMVQADPRRTGQVLVNLLSNAIKWNPPGGKILVSVVSEGEKILVSVSDQGPGVPSNRQSNFFLRFDQTERRDDRADYGAGLGLSVVKAIVEGQGGQVGVNNNPNQGAKFWFTLPVVSAPLLKEETPT